MIVNRQVRKSIVSLLLFTFIFAACQPATAPHIRLIMDGQPREIAAGDLVPAHMLIAAAIPFSPADRVLVNGTPVSMDLPIQAQGLFTLQLRRAVPVILIAPNGQVTVNTAAFTVGEALREAGVNLFVSDKIEPGAETAITSGMTVTITPGRDITVQAAGQSVRVRSSAATVGQVLAEAGIPLVGLDTSTPSENEALPIDGQIRIVRVTEAVDSAYKVIPYQTEFIITTEIKPPAQDVLDAGEVGISLTRTRIRYADGAEVARLVESESTIRLPRTRVARSSYWKTLEMYATSYNPCETGTCSYGTSSGMKAGYGIVALNLDWYRALKGVSLYIPGYGTGVVGDVCPGCVGKPWIDLGYDQSNYVGWSSWVTVYFLAPAPPEIPWFLQ
jgi:3D (Asp-Asp-Asp) domain-containing protein